METMNLNTMFAANSRDYAWNGIGEKLDDAPTSADAIRLAGLDWEVEQKPVLYNDVDTGYRMNIRGDSDTVLGVVGNRYKVVQNLEAFDFMDELLGEGITYETAGCLNDGKRIWLLARMPLTDILGDKVEPYMVLSNSHDGLGSLKVAMTPTRVVCKNTLTLALNKAKRTWIARHSGSLESKKAEAISTLNFATDYMEKLNDTAESYSMIKMASPDFEKFSERLFPVTEEMGQRKEESQLLLRDELQSAYVEEDLANIRGTAWGIINAVADMVSHKQPGRVTANFRENNFMTLVDGNEVMNRANDIIVNW